VSSASLSRARISSGGRLHLGDAARLHLGGVSVGAHLVQPQRPRHQRRYLAALKGRQDPDPRQPGVKKHFQAIEMCVKDVLLVRRQPPSPVLGDALDQLLAGFERR